MSFESIAGQDHVLTILRNGLRQNRLSHAYIFSGSPGTGRKRTAMALAQAVLCTEQVDDACGRCLACRKVEHGNHPDIHWIVPDGASIKIEQIRDLQQQLAYRSASDGTKIYIIDQAERMTTQAANSLLKFIEEPISPVLAMLITENGHALLPTIQSRAQWLSFHPLSAQRMREALLAEGFPAELVYPAAELTAGLEAARTLIQGNGFAETRNVVIQLLKDCLSQSPNLWMTIQSKVMKTDLAHHLETLMDLLALGFKDLIHIRYARKQDIVYIDQTNWLEQQAWSREPVHWIRCMEFAVETRKRLRFHANPQLALEQFFVHVQGG